MCAGFALLARVNSLWTLYLVYADRRILEEQARMLGRFRELAERGLALVGENPRLREVRDLYAFLEREFPLLLAKLEEG